MDTKEGGYVKVLNLGRNRLWLIRFTFFEIQNSQRIYKKWKLKIEENMSSKIVCVCIEQYLICGYNNFYYLFILSFDI